MEAIFPNCWDGVNLESSTGDHVIYNPNCEDEVTCFQDPCPASHPVRIPEISLFLVVPNYEGGAHVFADGSDVSIGFDLRLNDQIPLADVPQ